MCTNEGSQGLQWLEKKNIHAKYIKNKLSAVTRCLYYVTYYRWFATPREKFVKSKYKKKPRNLVKQSLKPYKWFIEVLHGIWNLIDGQFLFCLCSCFLMQSYNHSHILAGIYWQLHWLIVFLNWPNQFPFTPLLVNRLKC